MRKKSIIRDNIPVIIVTSIISIIGSLSIGYANEILFAGNEVSYDNSTSGLNSTTVQGALDELCTAADFSDRVSTLENKFQNNTSSYFDGNWLKIKSSNSNTRGVAVYDAAGTDVRSYLFFSPSDDTTYLRSDSSSTTGGSKLNIVGSPVMINGVEAGKKPVQINKTQNVTTSTTFAYTGVSYTIPANSFYSITVSAIFNNEQPSVVGISKSSSSYLEVSSNVTGKHFATTTHSAFTADAQTFYIFAAYNSGRTNKNNITITGFYIPG